MLASWRSDKAPLLWHVATLLGVVLFFGPPGLDGPPLAKCGLVADVIFELRPSTQFNGFNVVIYYYLPILMGIRRV